MGKGDRSKLLNRRTLLRGAAATCAVAAGLRAAHAAEDDRLLDALINQNQNSDVGQGFDSASRTIKMPKASLPTLSPANVPTTEGAIARYEQIVANGGWPQVPALERARLGARNPAVLPLRQRLSLAGDLDPNAVENDV